MSKVRVVFLGTPEFAVSCLKAMYEDEHIELVGVVTQPDRPAGRKMQLQPSAVKNFCVNQGIRVISPDSVNTEIILNTIESWSAEIAVVVAFGQLLTEKFLKIFPLGAVNVHASLLPRWRGAAPIQRSIENGDLETGVCLQKIVKKLDAGDVLGFRKIEISEEMDAQILHDELALLGQNLLHVELMDYVRGNLTGVPQEPKDVTYAKKIDKSESHIDWTLSSKQIHNKIKAFVMGPGCWTFLPQKEDKKELKKDTPQKLKIHKVKIIDNLIEQQISNISFFQCGEVIKAEGNECWIKTNDGAIKLIEVQPESRNKMNVADFLKGNYISVGSRLT